MKVKMSENENEVKMKVKMKKIDLQIGNLSKFIAKKKNSHEYLKLVFFSKK
jgi:hypothetical protein